MLSASLIQLEYASKQWKSTFSYSARLLNLEDCLTDATGYAPGLSPPKRPISVLAQNLGGIPSVLIQVLFSLPICLLQGGVAKSLEGLKTPICYDGQKLA